LHIFNDIVLIVPVFWELNMVFSDHLSTIAPVDFAAVLSFRLAVGAVVLAEQFPALPVPGSLPVSAVGRPELILYFERDVQSLLTAANLVLVEERLFPT
jgi:hypothetical protein